MVLADGLGPTPLNSVFDGSGDAERYGSPSLEVGARIGPMEPRRYLSGTGPQPEVGRPTLGTLACRHDAVDEAHACRKERLHRAASDRQAHHVSEFGALPVRRLPHLGESCWVSSRRGLEQARVFGSARSNRQPGGREANGNGIAQIKEPPNNGVQLTKAARCAPFPFRRRGQSLRAAFAADPGCSAGTCGNRGCDQR